MRDILYPRPNRFKFYRDSLFFVGFMAFLAVVGFCATVNILIDSGYTKS